MDANQRNVEPPGPAAHLLALALATADGTIFVILFTATDSETAMLAVSFRSEPHG